MDAVLQREPKSGVPNVIETREEFEQCCERFAQGTGSLAADAERAAGYRYSHNDWLVQFKREGAGIALIDPVAIELEGASWDLFNEAIGDATWILHDAKQDLPGFAQLGMKPQQLFDTEATARMLGLHRYGLAYVTEHYLGITLAKEHSAADWSYRPLPRDWRNYAALDVELLIELEQCMTRDLIHSGKIEWAREEFDYILHTYLRVPQPRAIPWLHISHINDIAKDARGLAIARALYVKRDELAQQYDISPSLLLADSSIIEAAQKKPRNAREFRSVRCLNERVRMQLGNEQDKMFERYAPIQRLVKPKVWKECIQEALSLGKKELDSIMCASATKKESKTQNKNAPKSMKEWKTHHPERFERLQACKSLLNQIAEDTRTPIDVLLKPQILRNLCWQEQGPDIDVPQFLREQGARNWQIELLSASLSSVIIERLPEGQE